MRHPDVVRTLDVIAVRGELFIVMEHVHGQSLSQLLNLARASQSPVPNECPAHTVTLDAYCMDELDVTTAQYKACSDEGTSAA